VCAFPRAAIISKPNSLCRVFTSMIGLDSSLLIKIHDKTKESGITDQNRARPSGCDFKCQAKWWWNPFRVV